MESRRTDTRDKIQLGGLVVKAGLREEEKSVILGILIEGLQALQTDDAIKAHYQKIGDAAFRKPDADS